MFIDQIRREGETDLAISRRIAVPLSTIRNWRHTDPPPERQQTILTKTAPPNIATPQILPVPTLHLMATQEAARLLGVSPSSIRNWIQDGRLKAIRIKGRRRDFYRIRAADLADFLGIPTRNLLQPPTERTTT